MKNKIINVSKKKSFCKEIVKQFSRGIIYSTILIYLIIMGILGLFFSENAFVIFRMISGIFFGVIALVIVVFCIFVVFFIIDSCTYIINKIKAIKRYIYLPLTVEEMKQGIENGLFSSSDDYIKYICEQLRYKDAWNLYGYKTIKFTNKELILLCKSFEEVYNKPIIFTFDHYAYCKDYDYSFPFEFKTGPYSIESESIIFSFNEPCQIAIFCTDMHLAEKTIEGTNWEYTVYNVEEGKIKSSMLQRISH